MSFRKKRSRPTDCLVMILPDLGKVGGALKGRVVMVKLLRRISRKTDVNLPSDHGTVLEPDCRLTFIHRWILGYECRTRYRRGLG
jgi:hypothetical protein